MYTEFFAKSPLLIFPIASLVIFIAVFGRILVSTFRKQSAAFDDAARIPFSDSEGDRHG